MDTKLKKFRYSIIFKIIAWVLCCLSVFALSVVIVQMVTNSSVTRGTLANSFSSSGEIDSASAEFYNDLLTYTNFNYEQILKDATIILISEYENIRQNQIAEINNLGNHGDTGIAAEDIVPNEPLEDYKARKIAEINAEYGQLVNNAEQEARTNLEESRNIAKENINKNTDFIYVIYDELGNIIETNYKEKNVTRQEEIPEFANRVGQNSQIVDVGDRSSVYFDFVMTEEAKSRLQNIYDYHRGVIDSYVFLLIIILVVGGASFVWLLLLSGRRTDTSHVVITKHDKIPNDIGAVIVLITTIIGFAIVWMLYKVGFINLWNFTVEIFSYQMLWIALSIFLFVSIFLIWATSTAKRIKRKEKYLLIYMGIKGVVDAAKEAKIATRYVWGFIGLIAIGIFLMGTFAMSMWYYSSGFSMLLWFILLVIYAICILRIILQKTAGIKRLSDGLEKITAGEMDYKIKVANDFELSNIAEKINNISGGFKEAVDKEIKSERMKTELITNISHDIKTPLTSILTYVDLLKKQEVMGEEAKKYINVIDIKSQRLKILTEDLFEAAKATSGNITVEMTKVELIQFTEQVLAEFLDKIEESPVIFVNDIPDDKMYVFADGKLLVRVLSNIIDNALKYSLENSRVYLSIENIEENIVIVLKNVSGSKLNITEEELMERFVRGDVSRHTEGSGLGLAIAKDFMKLMGGELDINIDGDLFKVNIVLKEYKNPID